MTDIHYQTVTPEGWPRARGYSYAVVASGSRQLRIAGQFGTEPGQTSVDAAASFPIQWARAMQNLVTVLRAAGGAPENLVMLRVYVKDMREFQQNGAEIGKAWGETLGKHFPAMTLIEVSGFVDPRARLEIEAEAILP